MAKSLKELRKKREEQRASLSSNGQNPLTLNELRARRNSSGFNSAYTNAFETMMEARSGWKDASAMQEYRKTLDDANKRMSDYISAYSPDQSYVDAYNNFAKAYQDFGHTESLYSNYINEDAFNKARRKQETAEKYKGLSYDDVKKKLATVTDKDEQKYLKNYTDFNSLEDFDKAIAAEQATEDEYKARGLKAESAYKKSLTEARNRFEAKSKYDKYAPLASRSNFEEKSDPTQILNAEYGMDTDFYKENKKLFDRGIASGSFNAVRLSDMNEEMQRMGAYILNTQGEDAYLEYMRDMTDYVRNERADIKAEQWSQYAKDNPVLTSIGSSVLQPIVGGVAGLEQAIWSATGHKSVSETAGLSSAMSGATAEISQRIRQENGDLPAFAYDVFSTGVPNRIGQMMFGSAYNVVMGMSSFANTYANAVQQGEDPNRAVANALVAGSIEFLTEQLGMEWAFGKSKHMITTILKQALAEGSEEVVGAMAQAVWDAGANGAESEFNKNVAKYREMGYEYADAVAMARADFAKDVAYQFAVAAASTAPTGGVQAIVTSAQGSRVDTDALRTYLQNNPTADELGFMDKYGEDFGKLSNWQKGAAYGEAVQELSHRKVKTTESAEKAFEDNVALRSAYQSKDRKELKKYNLGNESTDSEGNKISVDNVSTEDGKTVIESNGQKYNADEVTLSENDAYIVNQASKIKNETLRNLYVQNYNGQDIASYDANFELASEYGGMGLDKERLMNTINTKVMPLSVANDIYDAARVEDAEKAIAARKANTDLIAKWNGKYKKGNLDLSSLDTKNLTKDEKRVVDFLKVFSTLGMNIKVIKDSSTNISGNYDTATGDMLINLAGKAYIQSSSHDGRYAVKTFFHESTHMMKNILGEEFDLFQSKVREYLGADWADRVAKRMEAHKISEEEAEEEVVARFCEDFYINSEEAEKFFSSMDENAFTRLFNHIKAWFKKVLDGLNEWVKGVPSESVEAQMAREIKKEFESFRKEWVGMFERSLAKRQAMEASMAETAEALNNANEFNVVTDSVVMMSEATYEEPTIDKKTGKELPSGRDYLQAFLNKQVKLGQLEADDITNEDGTGIMDVMERMLALSKKFSKDNLNYVNYSKWQQQKAKQDIFGKWITAKVSNGDYKFNIDFATVCKKRKTLNKVLNQLIRSGVFDNYTPSSSCLTDIIAQIKKMDFEVACALCFVDAKRYRVGQWATNYLEGFTAEDTDKYNYGYNELVRKIAKIEGVKVKAFDFLKVNVANLSIKGKTIDQIELGEKSRAFLEDIMENNGNTTNNYKKAKALLENPSLRKTLAVNEIIASEGLGIIQVENPTLFSMIAASSGSATPKLSLDEVAFTNEIVKDMSRNLKNQDKTRRELYQVGGYRFQSFSDYMANMFFDYVQMISNFAAGKLPAHAYTKEEALVMIFGLTGAKINMSIVPAAWSKEWEDEYQKWKETHEGLSHDANIKLAKFNDIRDTYLYRKNHAGLAPATKESYDFYDEEDKTYWKYLESDESFGFENALKIQNMEGYDKNCGIIFVGVSDKHIRALLRDARIPYVIPYHKSNINPVVAENRGIGAFNNYEDMQNARVWKDGKLVKLTESDPRYEDYIKFNFYDALAESAREWTPESKLNIPQMAAKKYLDYCKSIDVVGKFAGEGEFADEENYYKLLTDFRLLDSKGNYAPQGAVTMTFPKNLNKLVEKSLKVAQEDADKLDAKQEELLKATTEIVNHHKKEEGIRNSEAISADEFLGFNAEVPTEEEIKGGNATWGGIPLKYKPNISGEARNLTSEIWISDKFFKHTVETQRHILNHEVAHNLSDEMQSEHTHEWQKFASAFVQEKEVPVGSLAYERGQRTYWEGLYGDIGATSMNETTTHAITEYLDNPESLKNRSFSAYRYVEEFMNRKMYSNETDSDGKRLTKFQAEYFKNSKLRDSKGRLLVMYHGTDNAGFTVFIKSDDTYRLGHPTFFFTSNMSVAKSYSGVWGGETPDRPKTFYSLRRAYDETGDMVLEKTNNGYRAVELVLEEWQEPYIVEFKTLREAQEYLVDNYWSVQAAGNNGGATNYEMYVNAVNPLVVDCSVPLKGDKIKVAAQVTGNEVDFKFTFKGEDGKDVVRHKEVPYDDAEEFIKKSFPEDGDWIDLDGMSSFMPTQYGELMVDTTLGGWWNEIRFAPLGDGTYTTREIGEYAYNNGYDSVIFKNIIDIGVYGGGYTESTVAITFKSEQADSIYNLHPTDNPDIRHSEQISEEDYIRTAPHKIGFTNEKIERLASTGYYGGGTQSNCYMMYIDPMDFLRLTTGKKMRLLDEMKDWKSGAFTEGDFYDLERVKASKDYAQPYLEIDFSNSRVTQHEGRHRMWQLHQMGYTQVPVRVIAKGGEWKKRVPVDSISVFPQELGKKDKFDDSERVYLTDLIPLTDAYIDRLKETFGEGNDAGFRFSEAVDSETYKLLNENENLKKRSTILEEDIKRLEKLVQMQGKVTKGLVIDRKKVEKIAGAILKERESKYDKRDLTNALEKAYQDFNDVLMNKGKITSRPRIGDADVKWSLFEGAFRQFYDIADKVLSESNTRAIDVTYKTIANEIRNAKVKFTEAEIEQAKAEFGNSWSGHFISRINLSEDGESLTSLWNKWAEKYPHVFNKDEKNKVVALIDTYKYVKDAQNILQTFNEQENIGDLTEDIYNRFWGTTLETVADKYEAQIKDIKAKHKEAMHDLREQRDEAIKRVRDHKNEVIKQVRAEGYKRLADLKQHYKDMDARKKDEALRRSTIKKIMATATDFMNLLHKNSLKEPVIEPLKPLVEDFLRAIDFSSKQALGMQEGKRSGTPTKQDTAFLQALNNLGNFATGTNLTEDLMNLREYLDLGGDSTGVDDYFGDRWKALVSHVVELSTKRQAENTFVLQQMTSEELIELNDLLKELKVVIKEANNLIGGANNIKISKISHKDIDRLDSIGKAKASSPAVKKLKGFLNWANTLPVYAFKHIGEGATLIFREMMDGMDKLGFLNQQIMDFANDTFVNDRDKDEQAIHEETLTVTDKNGNSKEVTFKISDAQLMTLHCLRKRAHALPHIHDGGIQLTKINENGKEVEQSQKIPLSDEQMDMLESKYLSKEQIDRADKMQKFLSEFSKKNINEVTLKMRGVEIANEEYYFPIDIVPQGKTDKALAEKIREQGIYKLLNSSFTKPLVDRASNPIAVGNIYDVFIRNTSESAKYNAYALPMRDMIKYINYRNYEGGGETVSIYESLTNAFGQDAYDYIIDFLKDLGGLQDAGRGDTYANTFVRGYKVAQVAANLQVAILQPVAITRASLVLPRRYILKAMAMPWKIPKGIKKMHENSGVSLIKEASTFDINLSRGMNRELKKKGIKETIVDWSTKLASVMDTVTWATMWNACEAEYKDKNGAIDKTAYKNEINKRFRDIVFFTQVTDSVMTRSSLMRSQSQWAQMATAFASEPTVTYNVLQDSVFEYAQDVKRFGKAEAFKRNGKRVAKAVEIFLVNAAVESILRTLMSKYRKPDDEEDTLESLWKEFLEQANPLNTLPLFRDIYTLWQGYDVNRMDTESIANAINAFKKWGKIAKGDKDVDYKTIYNTIQSISQLTGVPAGSLMREVISLWNLVIGNNNEDLMVK